ncbi:mucin-2-like isoform X2 [Cylas formicarius]|uniref:mucin-2-like isoform X2 n=1 Tax=Cylas formicarius TaxID=197179 RepID=UPI0029586A60|nr:mucin-2-like isoform X2 [Cylas formicarius]
MWCYRRIVKMSHGLGYVNPPPRRRREENKDVTTVLLVDNHGKSSIGRFLSVKPELGLITSTARTFIQDGVTTEYATQVLGTTLDNGRLYAHLLTKSSRVLYDGPTKSHNNNKWTLDDKSTPANVRNLDYISPNAPDAVYVFPTVSHSRDSEEILKEQPSNNARIPYDRETNKVFKINANENVIPHKDTLPNSFGPSKVTAWENLPTFTVRNEFSPSGFSFLGDLPDFDARTERTKLTTSKDRKAKLLFKAGLVKPNPKELETVTYSGFADFTTTVANTVIVFTPHTAEVPQNVADVTKISVEPTIKPTSVQIESTATEEVKEISLNTKLETFVSQNPPLSTHTSESHKFDLKSTMVIDKKDRNGKSQLPDEPIDLNAKFSVLAHEQQQESGITFTPDIIQPSETQPAMLSTPSDEDIAKILASLQALAGQTTQPLSSISGSTIFFDADPMDQFTMEPQKSGGATTIFFEDELEPSTTRHPESTTAMELPITTTEQEEESTTEEVTTVTDRELETTPQNEIDTEKPADDDVCTDGKIVIPSTTYKTLTYLTTFFIPGEETTSTSIKSNIVVSTVVNSHCNEASVAVMTTEESKTTTEQIFTTTEIEYDVQTTPTTPKDELTTGREDATTPQEVTTETRHVTESEPEATEATTEEGDEIQLIFKTLYTTYTYLTTYFQDSTSSVASRVVVTTNVITSTLDADFDSTDPAVAGLLDDEDDVIVPSRTVSFDDLAGIQSERDEESSEDDILEATPALDDEHLRTANGVKTFYTTYTYFTTIFVDGETEISNRTEVYTNYVTPSLASSVGVAIQPTKLGNEVPLDEEQLLLQNKLRSLKYDTLNEQKLDNEILNLNDYETVATVVRSSTSKGDARVLDNLDKRNVLVDDQIVSESNNDSEIIPSPTLLLQTSYTTFTYFTTMYHGTTSSDVASRLETVTNVVTQTLTPTETLSAEDSSLPVTYFTTFTYWTTLYKDGETRVTSREETISNVVTPTVTSTEAALLPTASPSGTLGPSELSTPLVPSTVGDDELTTFFTTYTYYTTSYVGDETILNSRLETVTNVLNQTDDNSSATGNIELSSTTIKSTGRLSTVLDTLEFNGTTTNGSYAKVLESTSLILPTLTEDLLKPTGIVSINQGKIVDADGVSTLFYTTQAVGTYIDDLYAQVIESTSSLAVDQEKKSSLGTDLPTPHRTGLVRLIEGSIVQNQTTTLYRSKVLGTVIDGRYAQIIESTSSFLLPQILPSTLVNEIVPSPTKSPEESVEATATITPAPVAIEGSINEESLEDEDDEDKPKSRLSFQSKKRTFTPAIRPFASRQRPTFAPKRSKPGQTTAATITRSDFTPTVTAVPASKQNRFGARRSNSVSSTVSGSRRFSKPTAGARRSGSSRIQPTSSGSSRRGGFRTSASSLNRQRIRPTGVPGLSRSPSSKVLSEAPPDEENELTTDIPFTEDTTLPLQSTTESARRSNNPLLRFRRPNVPRTSPAAKSSTKKAVATTTTTKPRTTRPTSLLSRSRSNNLFPRRNLFTTTTASSPEEPDLEEDSEVLSEEDTDYDSSLFNTRTENPPTTPSSRGGKTFNSVSIKPFFRKRFRRDTYSKFRRPSGRTTPATVIEEEIIEEMTPKPAYRSRFQPNKRRKSPTQATTQASTRKRISPSKPSSGRTQFTLREKDAATARSNFKRRGSATTRTTTTAPRANNRSSARRTTTTRSRGSRRPHQSDQNLDDNFVLPSFDGTITITHRIPTESTIPVVNGKITEYKNIVTAKYSTEVLNPIQYSTSIDAFGKELKVLSSEKTSFGNNGATLITQFVLRETPTTSVTYTPTYIRGRKTSFSHVIPSTAYGVEEVVNTIQPVLAAQAPLANILLSQLLLGGGLAQNPLLALQNSPAAATPTTEYKIRTTSYVTTVTSTLETVIPLTFRGKEILTTILDTTAKVVTATEFLTDTVVVTPTQALGFGLGTQLNTLLLPLLQQQLQSQVIPNQIPLQPQNTSNLFTVSEPQAEEDLEHNDLVVEETYREMKRKNKKTPVPSSKETSVITLYVSGRTPGEFSTVLSTVTVGDEGRRKREVPVKPSARFERVEDVDGVVMPAPKGFTIEFSEGGTRETESLESIIGDVTKHVTNVKPTEKREIRYVKASEDLIRQSSDDFLA